MTHKKYKMQMTYYGTSTSNCLLSETVKGLWNEGVTKFICPSSNYVKGFIMSQTVHSVVVMSVWK